MATLTDYCDVCDYYKNVIIDTERLRVCAELSRYVSIFGLLMILANTAHIHTATCSKIPGCTVNNKWGCLIVGEGGATYRGRGEC